MPQPPEPPTGPLGRGSAPRPTYHAGMTPSASSAPSPRTVARTRRAILDAAVAVFAENHHASLSDVARAAEVGRSTLHRYFPDRAALVRALLADCAEATRRVLREAALQRGTPAEAFPRLVAAMFELGPRVNFLFAESGITDEEWNAEGWEEAHWPVGELFERGKAEGYFAAEFDADWFVRSLWYMMSAGWEAVADGTLARHEAIAKVTQTLASGMLAREPREPREPRGRREPARPEGG